VRRGSIAPKTRSAHFLNILGQENKKGRPSIADSLPWH
jgi:hypothetical protein